MRRILRASKRLLTILGGWVPETGLKGLERTLQNATKPTAFKNLLRLRTYCVQEGTAFKKVTYCV